MSRAIDDLVHEHEAIGFALKILDSMARGLLAGEPVDPVDLQGFIGFLKEFVDTCHHGKEEGVLFPALVAAGIANEGGPVGVMLDEHVQGRQWIARMQSSLQPPVNAAAFAQAAQGYRALLEAHIQKENQVLFPMAERALPEAQLAQMAQAFDAHESQVMGAGRHEQLHAQLHEWKDKYLPVQ